MNYDFTPEFMRQAVNTEKRRYCV